MKQYLLDEIAKPDLDRITAYLNDQARPAGLEGLWWVELPQDLLTSEQQAHPDCQPHRFAVELGRAWIMDFADRLVEDLQLRT